MAKTVWNSSDGIAETARLTVSGLLGFYTHFEVTEIVAFPSRGNQPINVFTILVAEERPNAEPEAPHFLNASRIKLPNLRDWRFGICRYTRLIGELVPALEQASATGTWATSGQALGQAALATQPPQFVPPDTFQGVPCNHVLKNNFWNGSYILEWSDTQKSALTPLFDEPHRLQALSDAVGEHVPIHLASLSDRLGNLVLQLPITVLMARFNGLQDGTFVVETGWHPKAAPRPLRASIEMEFDGVVSGYASCLIDGEQTVLPMPSGPGTHRGILWDEANGLVLAATGPSAFIRTVAMNLRPIDPEPRVFVLPEENGATGMQRVGVYQTIKSLVGTPESDGNGGWTRRRMYHDETSRLVRERRFIQYRPEPGNQDAEHERALGDIRHLIAQYGEEGAWLWDPYLSARDILKTLFFSPHSGAELRGLTATQEPVCQVPTATSGDYIERQRQEFVNAQSNFHGLRLEYRSKNGSAGWAFHDRFLIFPRKESSALAWSLGTSVNSLGKAHHILQRVDDGQQVMDAFVELWDQLGGPEYLIWKAPGR